MFISLSVGLIDSSGKIKILATTRRRIEMGFLKFLLAIALIIIGGLGMASAFLNCVSAGVASSLYGTSMSEAPYWIIGVVGFVIFLGGIYMLRKR